MIKITKTCLNIFWWLEVRYLCWICNWATGAEANCARLFFLYSFQWKVKEQGWAPIRKQKGALCECFLCGLHQKCFGARLAHVPFFKHGHQGNNCCASRQGTWQSYEVKIPWGLLSVELSSTTENCERRWPQETVQRAVCLHSPSEAPT